jgi:hypothetical protein
LTLALIKAFSMRDGFSRRQCADDLRTHDAGRADAVVAAPTVR